MSKKISHSPTIEEQGLIPCLIDVSTCLYTNVSYTIISTLKSKITSSATEKILGFETAGRNFCNDCPEEEE